MSDLRSGYTTGSCAAAAAKAALLFLAEGIRAASVEIPLPDGSRLRLPVTEARLTADGAVATVRKDAGDDPDVTDGALIEAAVSWTTAKGIDFVAGEGVGTVTLPGLALPPGEPAINPGPRRMIAAALREVTEREGLRVTIAIPGGEDLAARTFNPRIGIRGGLSILGTTGIVRPFSCSALRQTVRCALAVAAAAGVAAPILVPGHIGERAARGRFAPAEGQVVEVGNLWGFALDAAREHAFAALMLMGHPGKLAKLVAGHGDTHSGRSGSAVPIVAAIQARVLGRPAAETATVEGLFQALDRLERRRLGDAVAEAVRQAADGRLGGAFPAAVVMIDLKGEPLGEAGDPTPWR